TTGGEQSQPAHLSPPPWPGSIAAAAPRRSHRTEARANPNPRNVPRSREGGAQMKTLATPWSPIANKLGQPPTAPIPSSLLAAVLGTVNGLDFPLSVPYQHRVTGQGYLDFCSYCSAGAVQSQVEALGVQGRLLQALLLCTIDIVIPTLTCIFGIAALAAL